MKINEGTGMKSGNPGARAAMNGRKVDEATKMMGSNKADSHANGAPGAKNARDGKVVKPMLMPAGGEGQTAGMSAKVNPGSSVKMGNPGAANMRKGTVNKTAMFKG